VTTLPSTSVFNKRAKSNEYGGVPAVPVANQSTKKSTEFIKILRSTDHEY
jgi:hypothetical protein